jgi:hypothetical protein
MSALTDAAPDLLRVLKVAVAVARDRHRRSVEAADYHNNLDGVGQRFDYIWPEPLPVWLEDAEAAIAKALGRS